MIFSLIVLGIAMLSGPITMLLLSTLFILFTLAALLLLPYGINLFEVIGAIGNWINSLFGM